MARFDVYANPDKAESRLIPFFLDVQSDHVVGLETRIVVPLWRAEHLMQRTEHLNPEFELDGQTVVMDTPALGAVPARVFKRPVANLGLQQLTVQDALDTLFGNY